MSWHKKDTKHLMITVTVIVTTFLFLFVSYVTRLFHSDKNYITFFPQETHHKGPTVYFLETSWKNYFSLREACAIESAARAHPNSNIKVILTSPIPDNIQPQLPDYQNIYYIRSKISDIIQDTPLEKWWEHYSTSPFHEYHLSDGLRLALLWRNGGIYLDLDILTLRSMSQLRNTIGLKREREISSSVLIFDKNHTFLYECMKEFAKNYHPHSRDHQGYLLLDNQLKLKCNLPAKASYLGFLNRREQCSGIDVLPSNAFNPIKLYNWHWFFQKNMSIDALFQNSFACNLWARMSRRYNQTIGNGILLDNLAKSICPQMYSYGLKHKAFY